MREERSRLPRQLARGGPWSAPRERDRGWPDGSAGPRSGSDHPDARDRAPRRRRDRLGTTGHTIATFNVALAESAFAPRAIVLAPSASVFALRAVQLPWRAITFARSATSHA